MRSSLVVFAESSSSYRIKLTGFRTAITPGDLALLLKQKPESCLVERKNAYVGYIVKLKTMRYTERLMTELHDRQIGEHKLKCQLELNPSFANLRNRPATRQRVGNYQNVENDRARQSSRSRTASNVQSDENKVTPTQGDSRDAWRSINPALTSSSESIASTGRSTREFLFPETYHRSQHFGRRFQFSCRTVYQQVNGKSQRRYPTAIEKCCWYAAQRIGSVWRRSKSTQIDTRKPLIKS